MQGSEEIPLIDRPKTKFDLVERVGSKGKYQFMLLIIFSGVWCVTGMALIGAPFFFIDDDFKCEKKGLLGQDCSAMVCSLPKQEWKNFIDHTSDNLDTISTQFGPYYCQDEVYLDLASSAVYLGALIGYLLFSFYSDNFGRRITMIIAWGIATIGTLIILFSVGLVTVSIGLFLLGAGADASINMCFNFLGQMVENQTRQKYCVMLQPWFALGACIITTSFIFIHNWKLVALLFLVIPSVIFMFLIVIYIEETPQFLIRKGVQKTLKALNRVGKINKGIKNILTQADVINVINQQVEDKQFQKMITPADLCRFSSLRLTTICLCFLSFAIYALYYGPVLVIDKIGFNVFVSSYVVQFSQLIVYIPLYMIVDKIPRQKAGIVLFSIAGVCACILLFVNKPKNCSFCSQAIAQLVIIAIFRSSSALYFILLYIYMVQLYPARSRAMGGGIASAVGTIASTLSPIVLGYFQRNNINTNIIFSILSLLSIGVTTLLPQTRGLPLKQQIEQIEMAKDEVRRSGYVVHPSQYSTYKSQFKSDAKSQYFQNNKIHKNISNKSQNE